jgi:DNA-binding transcriptional MerR regulator
MELLSIGEVCNILNVKPHVLRYWEQEFEIVNPRKGRNGKRQYTRADLNNLHRIKHLLYEEKYTIEGAKQKIWTELADSNMDVKASIQSLRETLRYLSMKIDENKRK